MSAVKRMFDAVVRCTVCGKLPGCGCWDKCWCGWSFRCGEGCRRDHDAYIAGELLRCECGVAFGTREDCGEMRSLKRPCRCRCHRRDMREGRARYEASLDEVVSAP